MNGFLMFLGVMVLMGILIFGAWYVGTHIRIVDDRDDYFKLKHPIKKPTDTDSVDNTKS